MQRTSNHYAPYINTISTLQRYTFPKYQNTIHLTLIHIPAYTKNIYINQNTFNHISNTNQNTSNHYPPYIKTLSTLHWKTFPHTSKQCPFYIKILSTIYKTQQNIHETYIHHMSKNIYIIHQTTIKHTSKH
jgi:hypothetical protein